MNCRLERAHACLLAAALVIATTATGAAQDDCSQELSSHREACQAFVEGSFRRAATLFRRALEDGAEYDAAYGLVLALNELGRFVSALDVLDDIEDARWGRFDDEDATVFAELRNTLIRGTATLRILFAGEGIALVDGASRGTLRPNEVIEVRVDPGEHHVQVMGDRSEIVTVNVASRDVEEVVLMARDSLVGDNEGPAQTPGAGSGEGDERSGKLNPVPWILVGGGAAIALAGLIPGVMARSIRDDVDAQPTGMAANETFERAQGRALAANLLFGIGGGIAAAGLVWALVGGRRPVEETAVRLELLPGGLRLRGAF